MNNTEYLADTEETRVRAEQENIFISLGLDEDGILIPEKGKPLGCKNKAEFIEKIGALTNRQLSRTIYQVQMVMAGGY